MNKLLKILFLFTENHCVLNKRPIYSLLNIIDNFNQFFLNICKNQAYKTKYLHQIKREVDVWELCKTNLGGLCRVHIMLNSNLTKRHKL